MGAAGRHPSCPGSTRYEIASPVFDEIQLTLDAQYYAAEAFTMKAHDNSPDNLSIQIALFNVKPYKKCYIDFKDMVNGGTLELFMGKDPNKRWGLES